MDTPVLVAWLFAVLTVVALILVARRKERRRPALREEQLERTASHSIQLRALKDWLSDPGVVKAILSRGVATKIGLQGILETLESMEESDIDATVRVVLRERIVRMVVAAHIERTRPNTRGQRAEIMRALLQWAKPDEGLEAAL